MHGRFYEQAPDPGLSRLLPADADIERVNALSMKLSRFIGVGEGIDDLAPFTAHDFARAIAGQDN